MSLGSHTSEELCVEANHVAERRRQINQGKVEEDKMDQEVATEVPISGTESAMAGTEVEDGEGDHIRKGNKANKHRHLVNK